MALTKKQIGTVQGMLFGVIVALGVIILGSWLNPLNFDESLGVNTQLRVAIGSSVLVCFFLLVSVMRLAKHRFFTPADIDGSGLTDGTAQAKLLQSLLQNTLEQAAIAVVVYLSWALLMPATWLSVVPLAAICFALGRILFFRGYTSGASSRAAGFALTFYPSAAMLLCVLVNVLDKTRLFLWAT